MTSEETLVYMLQLSHDCVQAKIDFVSCRNQALTRKPELYHHYGFMGEEFRNYFTWTRKLATPEEVAAIHEYYSQNLAQG
jgi:hypothetical protein